MRRGKSVVAIALVLPVLAACDILPSLTSGDCTTIVLPAISVTVVDSVTGASLAHGTTVRVIDGSFVQSITAPDDSTADAIPIGVAAERAGVYHVSVTHSGYIAWSQSNVRVTKSSCHVQTARLVARLVRAP
jgi:hypothetical protein